MIQFDEHIFLQRGWLNHQLEVISIPPSPEMLHPDAGTKTRTEVKCSHQKSIRFLQHLPRWFYIELFHP